MEKHNIEELILKYNAGLADPAEIKLLEHLIEAGTGGVNPTQGTPSIG